MTSDRLRFDLLLVLMLFAAASLSQTSYASENETLNIWPGRAPGETKELPPEVDKTTDDDNLIDGRRVIRLGNVSTPQITVYRPEPESATGAAVVICPGGGHYILAMDLEGTEVAEWLNSIGVTAIVLKYRVPSRDPDHRWTAAVQDAQRAMSLVRSRAEEWDIDPNRIGICGFSAGGETAALTSIFLDQRQYEPIDEVDEISSRPDFAMLIYPANLIEEEAPQLRDYLQINGEVPPMFFAHAFDDRVSVNNSLVLATHLKNANVPAELHIYESGGHGYGLRRTDAPITSWPDRAHAWMKRSGFLGEFEEARD